MDSLCTRFHVNEHVVRFTYKKKAQEIHPHVYLKVCHFRFLWLLIITSLRNLLLDL